MQDYLIAWRHRRRGNAMMIILALIFIMLTLVAGLHYRQQTARSAMFHQDAQLQARVAAEYEMARLGAPNATFEPLKQEVSGQNQHADGFDIPEGVAKTLFSEDGVMDIGKAKKLPFDEKLQGRPGISWNQVKASSSSPSIRPDKLQYLGVVSSFFPYVAYAPNGNIQAEETFGWRNQLFDNPLSPPDKAHSGGAIKIAAKGDLNFKKVPYGELYSADGKISVDEGNFVSFRGVPPNLAGSLYATTLKTQLGQARTALRERALNKTDLFLGAEMDIGFIWNLIKGDASLNNLLSIRQAMKFPFVTIPGVNTVGVLTNIWFHVPRPPDGASAHSAIESTNSAYADVIKQKGAALEKAYAELDKLEKEWQKDPGNIELQQEYLSKKSEVNGLISELKELTDKSKDGYLQADNDEEETGPLSRSQEGGLSKDGQTGWCYGGVVKLFFQTFANILTGQFDEILKGPVRKVRLVHFGREEYPTEFVINDTTVQMKATFNVPPGRSLRLDSNVNIRGDLWLMRGSTLVINGNLHVTSPQASQTDDPTKPQGKIYIEEGANLVVSGDLSCQGSPKTGSILVGAPYDKLHPVMGSILVDGNIDIPYAVLPAFSLADIDSKIPALKIVYDLAYTILPNLAKLDGPFHTRKPYFASYATTFQIWIIPTPLFGAPVIVPTCIPFPTPKNLNNPIFRVLTIIYTTQMNLAWGENFLTHTDWWFFGDQVVPMFPKVDPTGYLDQLSSLNIPTMPGPDMVKDMVVNKGKSFVKEMVGQLIATIVPELVNAQLGFPYSFIGDFATKLIPLDEWFDKLLAIDAIQGPLGAISNMNSLTGTLQSKLSNLTSLVMMHETPGLLIHAGKNLSVATLDDNTPLTVGMLVAGKNITSKARMTVGTVVSFEGNIETKNLLYDPNVTRCSLYLPRKDPKNTIFNEPWLDWALEIQYGKSIASDEAFDIGPTFRHVTMQGWKK